MENVCAGWARAVLDPAARSAQAAAVSNPAAAGPRNSVPRTHPTEPAVRVTDTKTTVGTVIGALMHARGRDARTPPRRAGGLLLGRMSRVSAEFGMRARRLYEQCKTASCR